MLIAIVCASNDATNEKIMKHSKEIIMDKKYKSIGVKSLNITIPLACEFTEDQCHSLMANKYPDVVSYELRESYVQNESHNW